MHEPALSGHLITVNILTLEYNNEASILVKINIKIRQCLINYNLKC